MQIPTPKGLAAIALIFDDGRILTIDAANIHETEALGAVPGTFASPGRLGPRRIRITFDVYAEAWKEAQPSREQIEPPTTTTKPPD